MKLALFEPDIPQNTGAMMRLCACLNVPMDIIEPCGFILSDKNLRRVGMDYLDHLTLTRHLNWEAFKTATTRNRLVLLSTKSKASFLNFSFSANDILITGRESAGVPNYVRQQCEADIRIPMITGVRSLNIAHAATIVLSEALRQTNGFPKT